MSALDRFIDDAATRLDLGYRARTVVGVLAGWIAAHPLGLDGLEQQFEQAGLGPHFRSWQDPAATPRPLLASELEQAIGSHALATLARRTGFPPGTFRVIACELLPPLIGLVTPPHGHARLVAGAPRPVLRPRMARGAVPSRAMHGLALRSLLWVLAGLTVVGLTAWLFVKMRTPHWTPPAITAQHDASLSLQQHGQRLQVRGRLPTEAARRQLWNALVAVHGQANVHGTVHLDPAARPPRWLHRVVKRVPQLQGDGMQLDFDGPRLHVDTTAMADSHRLAISQVLRRDFADLHSTGLWGPGLAALDRLPPTAGAAPLLDALNQTRLTFVPGTAEFTGDCADTLQAVADALRMAPPGLRVAVDAHTDGNGDPQANLQLSQQRADAVVWALRGQGVPPSMLVAVGHGQEHPLADNRHDAGRERNRRIAYRRVGPDPGDALALLAH
ncbi:OmpA family protein [Stenotrophomonas sp.]|uniref:OmpA family protein n=1 Tax=Stenotrophomonas sp. TaxID=69392 RepID=UPI002FCA2AF0